VYVSCLFSYNACKFFFECAFWGIRDICNYSCAVLHRPQMKAGRSQELMLTHTSTWVSTCLKALLNTNLIMMQCRMAHLCNWGERQNWKEPAGGWCGSIGLVPWLCVCITAHKSWVTQAVQLGRNISFKSCAQSEGNIRWCELRNFKHKEKYCNCQIIWVRVMLSWWYVFFFLSYITQKYKYYHKSQTASEGRNCNWTSIICVPLRMIYCQ